MKRIRLLLVGFAIATASVVTGQNLISNPGFENGLNEWATGAWGGAASTYSVATDVVQEGTKAAKIDVTAAYPDDGGRAYLRKNGLRIAKDVPHKLIFHLFSASGNAESIVVSMYSHTNIGSTGWGSAYSNTDVAFAGDSKWHRIELDFTPTNLAGEVDFNALGLLFGFAKNAGTIYIDSIALISDAPIVNNNIHVSVYGDDNANGSLETPVKTLAKAASMAQPGDTVFIHKGTYYETLEPVNSGLPGSPIVYQAFSNEKVIISAMQELSGWQHDSGDIYKTHVDWSLGQNNFVMHDTTALDLARWPNNTDGDAFTPNSKRNAGGSNGDVINNAYLTSSEIPNFDWSNGAIWFYCDKGGSGWTAWKAFIKSSTAGKVVFDLDKNPTWIRTVHPPASKGDFYLEGIKEALDFQNEWYYNENEKMLYVQLPGGLAPEDGKVQMRKRELVIDLNSNNYIEIKNLAVFGGGIEIQGNGNVLSGISDFYGAVTQGVVNSFRAGAQSIYVKGGNNNVIENSEIAFGAGSGIWDQGNKTKIDNCYIHDFNTLGFYDAPVNARGTETQITYNTISHGGRDALQITAVGSTVAYNDISWSNLIADDCGLFYSLGADKFIKIHHNWFHDAQGRGDLYKAAGIYLDNDAADFEVYQNVVWNTEWTGIQINLNGENIDVLNNTFWNGSAAMGAWHKDGTSFKNVRVWNNLSDDSNWEEQADKQNNLTVSVNPFTNSAAGDFTLKANSQPIDKGKVIAGITDGFVGAAPDAGAYEFGGTNWKPGIKWEISAGPTGNGCYGLPGESCDKTVTSLPGFYQSNLQVYPNPVAGSQLFVDYKNSKGKISWQFFSINGTLLKNGNEVLSNRFSIDVADVKPGIYFLKVNNEDEIVTKKIIKN